jgi:hypothetical protein
MVRLTIETLDGRVLMSAGVSAAGMPVLPAPRTAVMTQPEESAGAADSLTAPLGSTKGSVVPVDGFTPPIGSNKGSLTAGFAGDGLGALYLSDVTRSVGEFNVPYTYPDHNNFSGDIYLNEMGVVGTNRDANGIIAVLIGLRAPQ